MQTAYEVCGIHYAKQCHVCPIRRECVSVIKPGREGLDEWERRVEEAAVRWKESVSDGKDDA